MQRLFSTFPNSWPGGGLLLLRLILALPAAADGLFTLLPMQGAWAVATGLVLLVTSALVLLGLWTPYAAAILGAAQLSQLFLGGFPVQVQVSRTAIALSLLMLGPGAWSVDRLLFGRKRIDLPVKQPGS
jgi:putative oxidoreductase